jgi:hypothetical protein
MFRSYLRKSEENTKFTKFMQILPHALSFLYQANQAMEFAQDHDTG